MKAAITLGMAALLLAPGVALAGHGKAGLWDISATMEMASMKLPPETVAQMKKMGIGMPARQTFASQMCMTQAQVNADSAPYLESRNPGCVSKTVASTPSSMRVEMVCDGEMKGRGQMQISYRRAEHYTGTYNFQGVINGRPMDGRTSFKGDWIKAECGAVKPHPGR